MANINDDFVQDAIEIIQEEGMLCQWQKQAPITGGTAAYPTFGAQPTPVDVYIAWFRPQDLGRGTLEFLELMKGTEVPTGTEIGLMAGGQPFTPERTDTLIKNGQVVVITKIDRIAPNGLPILYYISVDE